MAKSYYNNYNLKKEHRIIVNQHFKSVFTCIKDLLPYLLLISIYFFFINIEAQNKNDRNYNKLINNELKDKNLGIQDNNTRIKIPIIPYNE